MSEVRLTPQALADLEEIWYYTFRRWGVKQAEGYLEAINNRWRLLEQNPELGRSCDFIRKGYRRFETLHHVIFYRHTKSGVLIVRILHESMDVGERL